MECPYGVTENCIDRLVEQWRRTPNLIVAVDFDDTVFDFRGKGHTYESVIQLLKESMKMGFYIVVFTSSPTDRYDFISQYMAEQGIAVHAINENPIALPYGNTGKIFYNIFLDDRAGLGEAMYILDETIKRIRREQ